MGTLQGKTLFVTGATRGIGKAIALRAAADGANVVVAGKTTVPNPKLPGTIHSAAREIEAAGGKALPLAVDVRDEAQVAAAAAEAVETFGGIDILVNCAAIFNKKGVLEMPLEEWKRQCAIILDGAFLFTKHAAKAMIAQRRPGSIINIISTAGHQGEPNNIAYCTAKSGMLNFTRSAAMELVRHSIRVNSITPTATDPSAPTLHGLSRMAFSPLWVRMTRTTSESCTPPCRPMLPAPSV